MKKLISIALLIAMLLTSVLAIVPSTSAAEASVSFEDSFDYDGFGKAESIYGGANIWEKEYKLEGNSDDYGYHESRRRAELSHQQQKREAEQLTIDDARAAEVKK